MNRILAAASVLALMPAAPAWAANPAAAPNGSVPYQPVKRAANGDAAVAPAANATTAVPKTPNEQAPKTTGAPPPPVSTNPAANPAAEANTNAEPTGATATAANEPVSNLDRNFVKEAASAGLAEIAAGKMAMARASDLAVRQFGRWMVTDHDEMARMLTKRAKAAGFPVSGQISAQDQNKLNQLRALNGVEFEKQYVIGQVTAHEQAAQLFSQEARSGQNSGLRALANVGAAMIEQHLAAAKELQSAMPEIIAAAKK